MDFPEVRGAAASNLSTTIWSLPPESLAISLNRATIWSRPQPAPRLGSDQDERVRRVPQPTSSRINERMDFSSTLERATAPAGRGKIFGWGLAWGGSAGSRGAA